MRTRTHISLALGLMVNAVLFGAGAIVVLSIPQLTEQAAILLPAVILVSLALTPVIAWQLAPRLRLRHRSE